MFCGFQRVETKAASLARTFRAVTSLVTLVLLTSCSNTIGGKVCGLTMGGRAILQNNGGDTLNINGNGPFTFSTPLQGGSAYSVTIQSQPSSGICTVSNGSGTVGTANVTNVLLTCGPFQQQVTYNTGPSQNLGMAVGDFNNDKKLDFATVAGFSAVVLLGRGDGTFSPPVSYSVAPLINNLTLYDGLSAVVVGSANPFRPISGRAFFAQSLAVSVTGSSTSAAGNVTMLWNQQATGTFKLGSPYATQVGPGSAVDGDFNGDGLDDLAVVNSNSNTVSVLLGNPNTAFQPQVAYAVGQGPSGIVTDDFNGDTILDLVVVNYSSNTVSVLLGNGDGTFQQQKQFATEGGAQPGSLVAADFNGDGKLDLAITNSGLGTVSVLLGNGDGTFQPGVQYGVGSSPMSIGVGDFNGDGKLDLAIVNSVSFLSVLLGNGNGTFQPQITYATSSNPQINNPLNVGTGYFVTGSRKSGVVIANLGSSNVFLACTP